MHAADRLLEMTHLRIEPERPDPIATAERHVAEQKAGVDRVIQFRSAVERLAHQVARVERQDDLVIAFGSKLLADQFVMTGRMLPIDGSMVQTRSVIP